MIEAALIAPFSLLAALLRLDRVVVGQTILHRPVFVAPLLGYLSGHLNEAVWIAICTEFISLLVPPTGTDIPPDEGGWAAIAMLSVLLVPNTEVEWVFLCIAWSTLALPVLRNAELLSRWSNARLAQYAEAEYAHGNHVPYKRLVFASAIGQVLLHSLVYFVFAVGLGAALALIQELELIHIHVLIAAAMFLVLLPAWAVQRANAERQFSSKKAMIAWIGGCTFGVLIWMVGQ